MKDAYLVINFIDGRERVAQRPVNPLEKLRRKNTLLAQHYRDFAVQLSWKVLDGAVQVAVFAL